VLRVGVRLACIVGAGAFGLLLAFAPAASAEVVDTGSPYQPAATSLVAPSGEGSTAEGADRGERASLPLRMAVPAEAEAAPAAPAPLPTAAPEVVVRPVPAPHAGQPVGVEALPRSEQGPIHRVQGAFGRAGAFLGEMVSACLVGVAGGTGGPVLLLAVLGMATALTGRRLFMGRWLTDEEPPEFLYVWDVIAPG